ncbi:MAG: BBP7 family outer membrane beta-barrel protein [Gemmataceae bacterium]|nr:BBP7 family outer membrane beta-barrel protein [Gemmataceae bacterium]
MPPSTWDGGEAIAGPDHRSCSYVSIEYLLWWIKSAPLGPPLLTGDRNNDPFSHIDTAGGLGDPNTVVLLGDSRSSYDAFSGVRLTGGWAFSECWALELSAFLLQQRSKSITVGSDSQGNPFLFRPIFNTNTNNPNSGEFVAAQDNFAGTTTVSTTSQLWGMEANLANNWLRASNYTVDALVGLTYLQLEENLRIFGSSTIIPPFGPVFGIPFNGGFLTGVGDSVLTAERFATRNQFYGFQAGIRGSACWGRLDVASTFKLALGATHESIDILGNTTGVSGASRTTVAGGILAVASNSGHFTRSEFAVLPQLNLQIGFLITSSIRAYVGYDLIYLSSVVRPGDQINLRVNDTQIPQSPNFGTPPSGPISPPPPFKSADFWAQGFDFGIELRF